MRALLNERPERRRKSASERDWAKRSANATKLTSAVNITLTAADADSVEASFRERLSTFEPASGVTEGQPDFARDNDIETRFCGNDRRSVRRQRL
jgi:hypothetical protein